MAAKGRPARSSDWGTIWQKPGREGPKFPYYAKYTGPDRKRHSAPIVFTTRRDARAFLDKCREAISDGSWTPQLNPNAAAVAGLNVRELFDQYLQDHTLALSTLDNYRKHMRLRIMPTLGERGIRTLTREDVRTWARALDPTKANSNRKALELLRSVLKYAVQEGLLDSNPAEVVQLPKVKREIESGDVLTEAQTVAYLQAADPAFRAALSLCVLLGLRSGEVRALRRSDVDLDKGELSVRQALQKVSASLGRTEQVAKEPKTKAARRTLPVSTTVLGILRAHIEANPMLPAAIMFPSTDGGWMDPSVLERAHHRALVRIGLRDAESVRRKTPKDERKVGPRLHDMRATYATWLAERGYSSAIIMGRLGWTDSKMLTNVYARLTPDHERHMLNAQDAAFAELNLDAQ